ncbi:MAG TPA: UDP-N-acetylglucosamine 2-epimerase (non-hydrolyzing), partial [Dehalococcoidia bacterium]
FQPRVCVTAQHRDLLDQVLGFFQIRPDVDLNLMRPDQSLHAVLAEAVLGLERVLQEEEPDCVVVQGDTTTTFAGALAAFYARIPSAHVEAGLRTGNKLAPYPEEVNRLLTARVADLHLAPTERARGNLLREGVPAETVFVTGNTAVDAVLLAVERVRGLGPEAFGPALARVDLSRPVLLVTTHRRESFGEGIAAICRAVARLARAHPELQVVLPVHPNPHVRGPVSTVLGSVPNVHLLDPLDYPALVWVMARSTLILTDSGGIQEEAPSLSVPVLVMRETTERPEGLEAGTSRLVGVDEERIVEEAERLLSDPAARAAMTGIPNPFGDGRASERIRDILLERFGTRPYPP